MTRISYFATQQDLRELLQELEAVRDVHYAKAGVLDRKQLDYYTSAAEIPDLGCASTQDPNLDDVLLVADRATPFVIREIKQRRGGVRYAVDQKLNPETISLTPGGSLDPQTVVAGSFATCSKSAASGALMTLVRRLVVKRWVKIKGTFVSPEAENILDTGGRLTFGLSREFDLHR